jgi:hypothetical protein
MGKNLLPGKLTDMNKDQKLRIWSGNEVWVTTALSCRKKKTGGALLIMDRRTSADRIEAETNRTPMDLSRRNKSRMTNRNRMGSTGKRWWTKPGREIWR